MNLADQLPESWKKHLASAIAAPSFSSLNGFLEEEYRTRTVFPERADLFSAFRLTPPEQVKAVILGQDPYHDDGQAHGLAFSVRPGIKLPPSLRNIFKELNSDLGIPVSDCGCLDSWAKQGVFLLNTVLTVRAHQANSHKKKGWEDFTDSVIAAINQFQSPVIFILWGGPAQQKRVLIDETRHGVIASAHPSPLSAYKGFFGTKPFSRVNEFLKARGKAEIDWTVRAPDALF